MTLLSTFPTVGVISCETVEGVAVFTSVLGILISTAAVTDLLVKVFTGLAVFSLGLVITAVFSFIYWLIKTTVNTNEN